MKGKYIVIEGSDGTGKTTQMNILREYLSSKGMSVQIVSEPADPSDEHEPLAIARELRKLIKNGEIERTPETNLLLFTAARVEKWRREIAPALEQGSYVLSSRNYWSTLAYQGYGEGLSVDLIMQQTKMHLASTGYLQPDAAVILTIDDDAMRQARVQNRGLHETKDTFETKNQQFQDNVANGYRIIADEFEIPLIDASGTINEVAEQVATLVDKQLQTV